LVDDGGLNPRRMYFIDISTLADLVIDA